jgi:hypothetical protein
VTSKSYYHEKACYSLIIQYSLVYGVLSMHCGRSLGKKLKKKQESYYDDVLDKQKFRLTAMDEGGVKAAMPS